MNPLDDFIERLTERLRPDKELAAEVGNELKSHIEEAVEEARREGMNDEEACQHALRRFGDPKQIADQLWKANLRRMKLRAVAKWGFRLVAAPAALLLALLLLWDGLDFMVYVGSLKGFGESSILGDLPSLPGVKTFEPKLRSNISEKDAAAYDALQLRGMECAERWVELFPDKPMFHANRITAFLLHAPPDSKGNISEEFIREGVALANEGERLDPDNAFYNYIKASLLWDWSRAAKLDYFSPLACSHKSRVGEWDIYPLLVSDNEMFQEGLDEFRKGVEKPRCDSYARHIKKYILSLERPRTTLLGLTQSVLDQSTMPLSHLGEFRGMNRIVIAYAADLVERGNHKDAADLLAIAPVPGTQLGQTADIFVALLVAGRMRSYALYGSAVLCERMGMSGAADAAMREGDSNTKLFDSSVGRTTGPEREAYEGTIGAESGMLGRMLFSAIRVDDASLFKPIRIAERAVVERTVLGAVAFIFLVEILLLSIRTLLVSRRLPEGARGVFIGWRRLAVVLLLGVIVPIGFYAAFARSPLGSSQFGMNAVPMRAAMELGVAMTAVLVLVNLLGCRAIRIRADEVGLATPRRTWTRILLAGILWFFFLGSLGIALAAWDGKGYAALAISSVVAIAAFVMLIFIAVRDAGKTAYYATQGRSLLPVIIAALLLLGIAVRFPLKAVERNAVAVLETEGRRLFLDEIDYSTFKAYRTYLRSLPDHGRLKIGTQDSSVTPRSQ
jgi:hypothetical protein